MLEAAVYIQVGVARGALILSSRAPTQDKVEGTTTGIVPKKVGLLISSLLTRSTHEGVSH